MGIVTRIEMTEEVGLVRIFVKEVKEPKK